MKYKFYRMLSENALFPKLCVMLKKLSSKYQLYVCGNFLSKPRFWKKLLFSDSLLDFGKNCYFRIASCTFSNEMGRFETSPVE
ncbi:MAG: hypothetical protein B1H11_11210 [Desulfobacteraceae bacterium 4484_190.1]|nr:MAG: hypothetical protein B1H11_11210 [Desulfobacteraceae bacterium 4484_190.1]